MRTIVLLLALATAGCVSAPPYRTVRFIAGPAGAIRVDDGGSGNAAPVIFIHGNGGNHTQWSAQLAHLRKTRRAIAYDLRGMGESDPSTSSDYSLTTMAADLDAIADALRVEHFVLVAHSYGGAIAATYAAKHRSRVDGIIFADAAGGVTMTDEAAEKLATALRKNKAAVIDAWFKPILEHASDSTRAAVLASVRATPVDVFSRAFFALRSFDARMVLDGYRGPVAAIVAAGEKNPAAIHVQVRMPIVEIDGVSHWLMMDKPEEFNRDLDAAIAAVTASH